MGDRTYAEVVIHRTEKRAEVWTAVSDYLDHDWTSGGPPEDGLIELGVTYGTCDVGCGVVGELSHTLIEIDPGIVFEMHEDPKYEWLGEVAVYVPELGLWSQECDSNGSAVLNYEQVATTGIFTERGNDLDTLPGSMARELRKLYGRDHYDWIAENFPKGEGDGPDGAGSGAGTDDPPAADSERAGGGDHDGGPSDPPGDRPAG